MKFSIYNVTLAAAFVLGSSSIGCAAAAPGEDDAGSVVVDAGPDVVEEGGIECPSRCADDERAVLDCDGETLADCGPTESCDPITLTCENACQVAENHDRSIGCDYFATDMDLVNPATCFAAIVANTWPSPVKIEVEYQGVPLDTESFTRVPTGSGPSLTYADYDVDLGLPPGDVAILFLSSGSTLRCPVDPAVEGSGTVGTGISDSFRIKTDAPVVAYQINPYGGGAVATAGASLLIPTSAWGTEYIAVNASPRGVNDPSLNIIAREDATIVTIVPTVDFAAGGGVSGGTAGEPMTITLNEGENAQISTADELTGSIVTADKPVGFMAGQRCMSMPLDATYCDHGEQMIPPVRALGHRYAGVMYRPRVISETATFWRLVGAADDTQLTWSSDVGGPETLQRGESVIFETGVPFVVQSQDNAHPFMLFTYMTGSSHVQSGYGDPDFVLSVPPEQYLQHYVFFTDPTYPETNLVVVRSRHQGEFHDVNLDCAGPLTGWQAIDTEFEYTRVDLTTGDFQDVGECSTGRREISSDAPFGLWVWGWGTPLTATFTANVSYGYPGGMNVRTINDVSLRE